MFSRFIPLVVAIGCIAAAPARPNDAITPEAIQKRIQQHRTAEATLTVLGRDGKPLPSAAVVIRQTRHKFLFGCNGFLINTDDSSPLQRDYQKQFSELLNFATLGFYWGNYERAEGKPNEAKLRAQAEWCRKNGIRTKGHPLCWHQVPPTWTLYLLPDKLEPLQLARIRRDVAAFAGLIDTWDVVNEAVVMPSYTSQPSTFPAWCKSIGATELIKRCFAAAVATNPKATLLLNDFNTSPKYEKLIRDCLDAGVRIDTIGIQSHMHAGYWGAQRGWDICERFTKFGKPLHFTELTILSGRNGRISQPHDEWLTTPEDEQRQAQQAAEFYTILFSHPSVQAITWWDFSDHRAWLGAPAGLVRKDMTPKPAYDALKKLIKGDWWTAEVKATTSRDGTLTFRGFLGDYSIETPAGPTTFRLDSAGPCAVTVKP